MELVTLDESGRIEIPQAIREQIGLESEDRLTLEVQDERLILKLLPDEPEVYYEDGVLVVNTQLLVDSETFLNDLRQERMNDLMSW